MANKKFIVKNGLISQSDADIQGNITSYGYDLTAIDTSISDTAVDVFVYDTRKDSDGGAWRKRTQHTSWYNETLNTSTRGARKEFPAVAVLVLTTSGLTIYDGDDPSLPMWMVFVSGAYTSAVGAETMIGYNKYAAFKCISMLNGRLIHGRIDSTYGAYGQRLHAIDFIRDEAQRSHSANSIYTGQGLGNYIVNRNVGGWRQGTPDMLGTSAIVNSVVNDVAMTVLPNAPIDDATGLPIPTIAVATNGGVSVIKDDGTVVDIASTPLNKAVSFINNRLLAAYTSYGFRIDDIPDADTTDASWGNDGRYGRNIGLDDLILVSANTSAAMAVEDNLYHSGVAGLSSIYENESAADKGMVAYTTSTYNTGWMNGDIKLATLSDTDDTDLVGSELVTNGDFSSALGSEWEVVSPATQTITSGELVVTTTGSGQGTNQSFTTVVGETYVLSADVRNGTGSSTYLVATPTKGNFSNSLAYASTTSSTTSKLSVTFTATRTTTWVYLRGDSAGTHIFDNVSVRLAEEDRSVNGNGLQVFGTIQKNPVATGADLVAYSGFSTSNYLQQPYNSDLEVGTGDIVFMGWVKKGTSTLQQTILQRDKKGDNVGLGSFEINIQPTSGTVNCHTYDGAIQSVASSIPVPQADWVHVVSGVQNGLVTLYVNGILQGTNTASALSTDGEDVVIFGVRTNLSSAPASTASLALWRISTTFPTAEQIKKIYEDEKVLFQEGAQATLYGSSDAVTALAYDDSTELLHVGTSAGRSVFQGLRRVDNTTDAVGVAISASNNLVVED